MRYYSRMAEELEAEKERYRLKLQETGLALVTCEQQFHEFRVQALGGTLNLAFVEMQAKIYDLERALAKLREQRDQGWGKYYTEMAQELEDDRVRQDAEIERLRAENQRLEELYESAHESCGAFEVENERLSLSLASSELDNHRLERSMAQLERRLGRLEIVFRAADAYCENDSSANFDALVDVVEQVNQLEQPIESKNAGDSG